MALKTDYQPSLHLNTLHLNTFFPFSNITQTMMKFVRFVVDTLMTEETQHPPLTVDIIFILSIWISLYHTNNTMYGRQ